MKEGFVISVDGGLGDHVCAEPAVRYLIEKVYPDRDVHIVCGVPRIFAHLSVPLHLHNTYDPEKELGYPKRFTFPTTGSLRESLCFLTTHMVDYHAAALLLRTLPLRDKEIRLAVFPEDRQELREQLRGVDPKTLIVVHAGKSWQTKTFPRVWWEAVVGGLVERGMPVCLVGKRDSDSGTGVIDVAVPPGVLDLRDALSLGALLALLHDASLLISNDTSLIQMAGAFNNSIMLIASCKHPDFVLPYRNGSPYHKARALYKRLLVDELPFEPLRDGVLRVDVPVADWGMYLPDPEVVVEEAILLSRKNEYT